MKTERVQVRIDEAVVARTTDTFALIEPLWERVDIYGTWAEYESTLRPFSIAQRHLFTIHWYRSEVNNGGHCQFFDNSTGIVWEHAAEGFDAIGLPEGAEILRTASARLCGASRDRSQRQEQLDAMDDDLADLDDRFFALEEAGVLDEKMLAFARQHAADFRFEGTVERVIFRPFDDGAR